MILRIKKGRDIDEINMSYEKAKKIKDDYENENISKDTIIVFSDNYSCRKSLISELKILKEDVVDDKYVKIAQEYENVKKEIKKLPADKRFNFPYFRFCWRWYIGFPKDPDENIIEIAKRYSKLYFEKHPERTKEPLELWKYMCKKENIKIPDEEQEIIKSIPSDNFLPENEIKSLSVEDKKIYDVVNKL